MQVRCPQTSRRPTCDEQFTTNVLDWEIMKSAGKQLHIQVLNYNNISIDNTSGIFHWHLFWNYTAALLECSYLLMHDYA